jgi:hypothetical protein
MYFFKSPILVMLSVGSCFFCCAFSFPKLWIVAVF